MLITCPTCGNKVSDTTENCIHCGCSLQSKNSLNATPMAIKICPECGTKIENSATCPKCGYSLQKPVNMDNVYASIDAITNYDNKTSKFVLLIIPFIICLIMSVFIKPLLFIIVGLIFLIPFTVLEIVRMLKRHDFILTVCKDKYSLISFIKEQNKNKSSSTRDKMKSIAKDIAVAFTCQENPTAKKCFRKLSISTACLVPTVLIMATGVFPLFLENCNSINSPLPDLMYSPETGAPLLPIPIIGAVFLIFIAPIFSKSNKTMDLLVEEWLKKQDNIDEEKSQKETNPVSNVEKTPAKPSLDDEFDLSNFDLNDL